MDFNEQFAIELKYLSVVLPEKKLKIYKEKIYRVFEFLYRVTKNSLCLILNLTK